MANKIRVLPPEIVSKIAAGEVIERPASVVKELVENSLDAGAGAVEAELRSSGKALIRIQDNGAGIARDDIEKLFSRHATSKISLVDDLYDIRSLGFRGEALYSVGAISDVILSSRTEEQDCAWQAHVRANEKITLKPCTRPRGTEIEVREIFFNTPARRKFLKSNAAELNAVIDTFLPYALMHPEKSFSLSNDGKTYLDLRPAKSHASRAANALNLPAGDLIEECREAGDTRARLVLGDINIRRPRKDLQFVFINGRPVVSRSVSFHMNEIYRLLFPPGSYPFFCVYVDMPGSELDVNVHPSKREVRIRDDLRLIAFLRQFSENLLMTRSKPRQAFPGTKDKAPAQAESAARELTGTAEPELVYGASLEQGLALFKTEAREEKNEDLKEKLRQARYLGNLLKRYLLFETIDALLVIDQHAAQERVTFERLKKQLETGKVEVQPLLAPVTLALTPQEILSYDGNRETLEKAGFETTFFDKRTLAVHSHPALIADPERAVRNLLAGESLSGLDPERIARMACRSSVMFGFAMNPEQAEFQRKSLLDCAAPFTCPHGRPTVIEIREDSLRKQFLRP